ncbi:MAG TPA: 50S ribosome-binding protein YggL [Gemmataceae bacterium]|jgi:uncharacterized protein YggL (DUF469 family)
MKKRLRKKRFLGEFAVFGFACQFRLHPPPSPEEARRFRDEFLAHIGRHGLTFDGTTGPAEWNGTVRHRNPRSSATQAHREVISAWLHQQPNIRQTKIGLPIDLHYGFSNNDGHTPSGRVLGD